MPNLLIAHWLISPPSRAPRCVMGAATCSIVGTMPAVAATADEDERDSGAAKPPSADARERQRLLDRPTVAASWQVLLLCWFLYSLGPLVLQIREHFHLSHAQAGAHSSMVLLGSLTAGLTSARVVRSLGRDQTRHAGMALLGVGSVGIAIAPGLWATLLGAYICGLGISTTVNALNPSVVDHHGKASASVLTLLNAAGATLGACAPLALAAAITSGVPWRMQVLAVAVIAATLVLFARTPFPRVHGEGHDQSPPRRDSGHDPVAHQRKHGRLFVLIAIALALGQLVEFSTGIYAVDVLRVNGGLSASAASAYAAAFIAGFALGRWVTIVATLRYPAAGLGAVAALVTCVGAAWVVGAEGAATIACGLFILGVGNGPAYPLLVSAALVATKSDRDRASAAVAIAGGGCAAFATLTLGIFADHLGLRSVFIGLSGTALVSAGLLMYALSYDRNRGNAVPTQRSAGV